MFAQSIILVLTWQYKSFVVFNEVLSKFTYLSFRNDFEHDLELYKLDNIEVLGDFPLTIFELISFLMSFQTACERVIDGLVPEQPKGLPGLYQFLSSCV